MLEDFLRLQSDYERCRQKEINLNILHKLRLSDNSESHFRIKIELLFFYSTVISTDIR